MVLLEIERLDAIVRDIEYVRYGDNGDLVFNVVLDPCRKEVAEERDVAQHRHPVAR